MSARKIGLGSALKKNRTEVTPEQAEAFARNVEQGGGRSPAKRPTAGPKKRGATAGGMPHTIYLPPDLAEEVRIACVREGCSISYAAMSGLRLWLSARKPS